MRNSCEPAAPCRTRLQDCCKSSPQKDHGRSARRLPAGSFSADVGMLIDGRSTHILATKVRFSTGLCEFNIALEGYGTRHHSALHVASTTSCVVITRSLDGYVTIFASGHPQSSQDRARCFRVQDEHGWEPLGPCTAVMERTFVRFDVTGKVDLPKQVSDVLRSPEFAGRTLLFPAENVLDSSSFGGHTSEGS